MADLYLGAAVENGEHAAPFNLSAENLTTHGIVVGMTGSGKTGLCLVLLEELVRNGVPIIAIDPKGDLGNLALLFPTLSEAEFAPWVEGEPAADVAATWKKGLERWGLGAAQVAALRDQLDLTLFTPGSDAGVGVDVLGAFRRPSEAQDDEARRAVVAGTVSGLLGLTGREADPVRDPAHIVLSRILDDAWAGGEDPDLETLILRLVDPPFQKVGVFPLDRFFPPKERMDLAMALNAVLASPTFEPWTRGRPLDIATMLAPPAQAQGKTRVSVFSLAHLTELQRQFFLSLLLGRIQAWSRSQPGTSSLRALVFFDEVAGWLPPHPANPPTKEPLLTMMKQARAVGLGVVLATQNPIDIDYKGISNAGLWAVGRLQTPQDRDRLLKGLGRPDLDDMVGGLGKRRFLIHQARATQPTVIESRFAMCYLRGPFTRVEIERVRVEGGPPAPAAPAAAPPPISRAAAAAPAPVVSAPIAAARPVDDGLVGAPPGEPGGQWFLDPGVVFSARLADNFAAHAEPRRPDGKMVWRPALLAELDLRFDEDRAGFVLDHHEWRVWFPLGDSGPGEPVRLELGDGDLSSDAPDGGRFAPPPVWMDEPSELKSLQARVFDDVLRSETRGMFVHKALKLYGRGDESRTDFAARVQAAVDERVDAAVAKLKDRVDRDAQRLDDQIARLDQKIVDQHGAIQSRKAAEVVNIGETVFAWFSGRTRSVSTAVSKRQSTMDAQRKLSAAEAEVAALRDKAFEMESKLEAEVAQIRADESKLLEQIDEQAVGLERADVRLVRFGVLWIPVSRRL
jgi:Helicase HerA, central domain